MINRGMQGHRILYRYFDEKLRRGPGGQRTLPNRFRMNRSVGGLDIFRSSTRSRVFRADYATDYQRIFA